MCSEFFPEALANLRTLTNSQILYGGSALCDVLIAVYMTYLVRTPRFYMYYYFFLF